MKIAELFDVRGLATIVTGAASGIGYAYAEAMADNGARVAMLDIDRAGLDSFFPVFSPQSGAACACETKPASMTIVKVASKRIADFMTCSL